MQKAGQRGILAAAMLIQTSLADASGYQDGYAHLTCPLLEAVLANRTDVVYDTPTFTTF